MRRFLSIVLSVLFVLPMVAQEELCMDGTLLFREDFGGNDPNDPRVGTTPVNGMTYKQLLTDEWRSMGAGKYLLTKSGYCNGDTSMTNLPQNRSSQWHLQDDHTYPNDKSRGYLLEIDGRGDNAAFYSTTIDGLCEGSKLTFSAYVANVLTWGMYVGSPGRYAYPRLKFVLTDPVTNEELATYDTGDIPFDSAFINDYKCWQQSAEWRLVGMNFTVPPGQNRIKLTIYNNATGTTGNDFALDDIEVRLCAPPVTIEGEAEVCMNEKAALTANFKNDGTFAEPLGYKWFFSADSTSWETLDETSNVLNISNVQKADSGWYQVAVAGADNIESLNCRAMSAPFMLKVKECVDELCVDGTLLFREDFGGNSPDDPDISMASVPGMDPSYHNSGNSLGSGNYTLRKEGWHNGIQWHWQDDHTYFGDKTRGYLLEVDGIGGAKPFYSKTIDGLCAGSKLTFSAYVVNVHYAGQLDYFGSSYVYPRMKFVLKDPETGAILAERSTGDIQPDWRYGTPDTWKYARDNQLSAEWQLIGMNFIVPEGVESIQMYIYNDVERNGSGNDFALDDIEIHLCAPPVTIEGESEICADSSALLTADFTNDGTFAEPLEYKWWFSADSITWTELSETANVLSMPAVQKADSGWYKVAVAGADNIESVNCRAMSEPFLLNVQNCEPPVPPCPEMVTVTADTVVCDTLMPYRWRDTLFTEPAKYEILYKDSRGCDSLLQVLTLGTKICCPDLHYANYDTIVCDTLMPFTWHGVLFDRPGSQTIIEKDQRDCDTLQTTWTLSTKVCCPEVVMLSYDTLVCDSLLPFTWIIGGQTFVFDRVETQERDVAHPKWTECVGTNYSVSLDTFHCERLLYPIIVNKYNWQLLVDNVTLHKLFPNRIVVAYQWYKNDAPIAGANDDDYSERNELNGIFQLRVTLDGNQVIWSNILTILTAEEEVPIQTKVYNWQNLYLIRYEQGDKVWMEKRLIP